MYRLDRKLGKGGFGQVYVGRVVNSNGRNNGPPEVVALSTTFGINQFDWLLVIF